MTERRRARVIQIGVMCRLATWQRRRHRFSAADLLRDLRQGSPQRT